MELKTTTSKALIPVKAILLGIITYILLLAGMALVFWLTPASEEWMRWASVTALALGCFVSGMKAGSGFKKGGLLWGFFVGALLVILITLALRFMGQVAEPSMIANSKCMVCILLGCIGGMVGVNK